MTSVNQNKSIAPLKKWGLAPSLEPLRGSDSTRTAVWLLFHFVERSEGLATKGDWLVFAYDVTYLPIAKTSKNVPVPF